MAGESPKKNKSSSKDQKGLVKREESSESRLSDDDLADLDEFCGSFDFDDIDFDAFCDANESLDICLFLILSREECEEGGIRAVEFTRTCKVSTPNGVRVTKEKTLVEVTWKKGSAHGDVICIQLEGDKDHLENVGNLVVTIKAS